MPQRTILTYCIVPSPLGPLTVLTTEAGVRRITFDHVTIDAAWTQATDHPAVGQLTEYFAGQRTNFDLALDAGGTTFQRQVWRELVGIAYGSTVTYSAIAAQIHRPNASRAVGAANGRNPIAIVVPCHRVIGKGGALTGYAGGLERKRALLTLEGYI